MLMKLAHLSDLHFGNHASKRKEEALKRDILAQAPDLVAVTGDLTDRGTIAEFTRAKDFLESLNTRFVTIPGNREVSPWAPWEWLIPSMALRRYSLFFGRKDRIIHESMDRGTVLFGLNSVHPMPSWPGRIRRDSRYWFKEELGLFPNHVKVLMVHHPVLPVVRSSSFWAHSFTDAGELLNIAADAGISLILQGHKHRASVMEISLPQKDARVVVVAGGAPLMPWWDCTYHIIHLSKSLVRVEPREYTKDRFTGAESYEFPSKAEPLKSQNTPDPQADPSYRYGFACS